MDDLKTQFTEIKSRVIDIMELMKSDVSLHQSWHGIIQSCEDRLTASRSKLVGTDAYGDKIAVRTKLDSVQVLFYLF